MTSVTARPLATPTMHTHGLRPRPARTAGQEEVHGPIRASNPALGSSESIGGGCRLGVGLGSVIELVRLAGPGDRGARVTG